MKNILDKRTDVNFYTEFMDAKQFQNPHYIRELKDFLETKYKNIRLDVIVTSDNYALYFVKKYYDQLFLNIPVVFCGINTYDEPLRKWHQQFTGVLERYDLQSSVDLIRKIHPNTETIFIVRQSAFAENVAPMHYTKDPNVKIRNLTRNNLTTEQMLNIVRSIKRDSIIIFMHWRMGHPWNSYHENIMASEIVKYSKTPVYSMSTYSLGAGILGGKMISAGQQGEYTAEIVLKVLDGIPPSKIPIQKTVPAKYMFDEIQLKRFGIVKSKLPAESILINHTPGFYQSHRIVIWVSFIIIIVLFSVIIFLTFNINKRRQIEQTLNYEKNLLHSLMDNIPDYIYFKDPQSHFIRNNLAHVKHLGAKTPEEVLGKSDFDFFDMKHASAAFADEQKIFKTGKPMINKIEKALLKDNQHRWVSSTKVPVYNENGELHALIGISRDITKHKKIEDQIASSLAEKEILLKEIHHRVKNNLQIICSLLNLQTSTITDEYVRDLLKIAQNRVRSMALIHDNLYRRDDFTEIDMKKYISDLIPEISRSFNMQNHFVDIKISSQQANLIIDQAIPCGLIINELITNAIKHAFPEKEEKTYQIHVRFRVSGKNASLVIKDNGIGIPEDLNPFKTKSLGLKLVTMLAEEQLKGKVMYKNNPGTEVKISFPIRKK